MMTHDACPSPSVLSLCVLSGSLVLALFLRSLSLSPSLSASLLFLSLFYLFFDSFTPVCDTS